MQALDIALERGDKAIAEGRDTVSDLREPIMGDSDIAQALTALGEELALQSDNGLVPRVRVLLEGKERELNPCCAMKSTALGARRCETPFATRRHRRSRRKLHTAILSFRCTCETYGCGIDSEVANQALARDNGDSRGCASVPRALAGS